MSLSPELDIFDTEARHILRTFSTEYSEKWTPEIGLDDMLLPNWIRPFKVRNGAIEWMPPASDEFTREMFSSSENKEAGTNMLHHFMSKGVLDGYFMFSETWLASLSRAEYDEREPGVRPCEMDNRESALMVTCNTATIRRAYFQRVVLGKPHPKIEATGTGFGDTQISGVMMPDGPVMH